MDVPLWLQLVVSFLLLAGAGYLRWRVSCLEYMKTDEKSLTKLVCKVFYALIIAVVFIALIIIPLEVVIDWTLDKINGPVM